MSCWRLNHPLQAIQMYFTFQKLDLKEHILSLSFDYRNELKGVA